MIAADDNETADDPPPIFGAARRVAGLVLLFGDGRPHCRVVARETSSGAHDGHSASSGDADDALGVLAPHRRPLRVGSGKPIELGRDPRCTLAVPFDNAVSRRHAQLTFDFAAKTVNVRDVGSNNGTFINEQRIDSATISFAPCSAPGGAPASASGSAPTVLRVGGTVFVFEPDVGRLDGYADLVDPASQAIVGPAMARVWAAAASAAYDGRSLFVHGETGTGKELVADIFHKRGPRASGPWLPINCARLERERAEVELFGAVRGAYTGAERDRVGAFEQANGGTLFLDEIAELSLDVQSKLLRVLEERRVTPVGSHKARDVDVALVCATHADLDALVREGKFRRDLLMRLVQRQVRLPPLRERLEEIPFFVDRFVKQHGAHGQTPSGRLVAACLLRGWPGNIRELGIAIDQAALASRDQHGGLVEAQWEEPSAAAPAQPAPSAVPPPMSALDARDDKVAAALVETGGSVPDAARLLGLSVSAVYAALARRRSRS